jgi:hypothetical protein
LLAAGELKMQEVPVIALRRLTPAQRRALVIAGKPTGDHRAGWDEEKSRMEPTTLHEESFDLDPVGFDKAELAELQEQHDACPGLC